MRSLHLLWYARSDWLLVLIPECTLMLLVVYAWDASQTWRLTRSAPQHSPRSSLHYRYYVLTEINQMRRAGRKYWSDPWNFWDWANICSFIVMAAARYA